MKSIPFFVTFDNDNSALNPQVWAQQSLLVLEQNTVMLPLVYRDFENEVASHGQVVNAHRPATFEAERKNDGDDVVVQDAAASNVPVRLDHHLHTSFMIYPKERSYSFKKLVELYMTPAIQSLAREADEIICAQKFGFIGNMVGKLGTNLTAQTLVDVNTLFNTRMVPTTDRYNVLTPAMEGDLLAVQLFTDASQVGDAGTALRDASIGKKYGSYNLMSQNMYTVAAGAGGTATTGAVNNGSGYAIGTTSMAVDGITGQVAAGTWIKIAGDARPRRVASATGSPNTTGIVLETAIESAVVNDAVITIYPSGAINNSSGYAQYYDKRLVVDGLSAAFGRGQMASLGATGYKYGAIGSKNSTTSLKLDRGLDGAVNNDSAVFAGPTGDFGMAFHKNAIAFVSRPIAMENEAGVDSAVINYNGLSLRATIWYNGTKQGHLVTIDMLCGVKVLDTNLGCLIVR